VAQLGDLLKAAREERDLTLDEVENVLCIRRHLLEALEESNFKIFPSPVVVRGLIRNYAKYLNIDPIEALTLYDGNGIVPVKGQRLTPNGIEFMNLSMAPKPFITWDLVIGILLFILVVGGASYLAYGQTFLVNIPPTPTSLAAVGLSADAALPLPTTTPLPTQTPTPPLPTDTPTPIVYSGVTVELLIQQSSWVQILVDDVKAFEGVLQVGDTRLWSGEQRVAIRAGNAGGVEVVVNGIYRGFMGPEGQVADQVWEKVEDPAVLTPESDASLPTETPVPVDQTNEASFETLPPQESQPPAPLDSAPETDTPNQ
jgi:cytoskeletal protein RodZ